MSLTRIAILNPDKCKPSKCKQECRRSCPVVTMGKLCIEVKPSDKVAFISEELCNGCGICTKKCPFDAIKIVNLPTNLPGNIFHRFGPNTFKVHRCPQPRRGEILGIVGNNGLGKSTLLKILGGKQIPNFGEFKTKKEWSDVIHHFRGNILQDYFQKISDKELSCLIKPQYVQFIPKTVKGTITDYLKDELLIKKLELGHLLNRSIHQLSGGELQRFAIAVSLAKSVNVMMFDEPSSFLDIRQRVNMANILKESVTNDNYIIVVEHDLSILDYLSDYICLLVGQPGIYGVVSAPFNVRDGINIWLEGMLPTENMRFRDEPLSFRIPTEIPFYTGRVTYNYPKMNKKYREFELIVDSGSYNDSEIIVLVGENGLGKTTFIKLLEEWGSKVSVKHQNINFDFEGTVHAFLIKQIGNMIVETNFVNEVMKPLMINELRDYEMKNLSGGELQRIAIATCLGKSSDIYLLDEPSSFLDAEMRINMAKVIRRYILQIKKTAFVVDHDFMCGIHLADKVIVFDGKPGIQGHASTSESVKTGMNKFLKSLDLTFRSDPTNLRPRINKKNSIKDISQKKSGFYYNADITDI